MPASPEGGASHIEIDKGTLALVYGAFIRRLRRSRGMSQAELAAVAGISQPNISAMENDRRLPSAESLNRLVGACGYELAAVAGDAVIHFPLPEVGWFPDEGLPPSVPGDPVDESPAIGPAATVEERLRAIEAVLELADQHADIGP
jgi:transcriptional regulator with XRE-family HTH domain